MEKSAPSSPHEPTVGIVLIDSRSKPLYSNAQAVRILSFPRQLSDREAHSPRLSRTLSNLVADLVSSANSHSTTDFLSGKRRYKCRIYPLNSSTETANNGLNVILLERGALGTRDITDIALKFRLTEREKGTVKLLLEGLTTKEIAQRMNISPNTVKAFLRTVMLKLEVSNRSGILAKILGTLWLLMFQMGEGSNPFG